MGIREERVLYYFYNKLGGNTGISGVEKFPAEKHFYDIADAGENEQVIEKFYAKIEGEL